jgi:hypothetical protein
MILQCVNLCDDEHKLSVLLDLLLKHKIGADDIYNMSCS